MHITQVTVESLSRVQERRLSSNFYSFSSNHLSFHKLGIFAPILMKLGPSSMKIGVLRCLSLSSASSGHHRGLQTWSFQPENKHFTLKKAVFFYAWKEASLDSQFSWRGKDPGPWTCYHRILDGLRRLHAAVRGLIRPISSGSGQSHTDPTGSTLF